MVVVAPQVGTVFRDDDSGTTGTCPNCPRVNIASVPVTGYYTVIVSQWIGSAADVNFMLDFERAPSGSAVCTPATTPLSLTTSPAKRPDKSSVPASAFGE